MSAPVQDVFSRLYGGKREVTKTEPVIINSAPVESMTISVFDRLYRAPSNVKFRMSDKASSKPKQLQPLFRKVDESESSKKVKKGSKLDPRKVKSDGNLSKVALKQPEIAKNSKKAEGKLKELEKESQQQKSKAEGKLKNTASEVSEQKNNKFEGEKYKKVLENPTKIIELENNRFEGEKYKKVLENPTKIIELENNTVEGEKYKKVLENPTKIIELENNTVEDVLNLNQPGRELVKQKKGCTGKKKEQDSSNSDRGELAAESEDKLGEKPFIVLSTTEQANSLTDKNEKKEKGSNSDANSTDGIQLFGGYQPHKISKENRKLRDEILDENRRSSLSFMKGDDKLPIPVNLEDDRNSPVWHDDYYVKDEEEPKGKKLSQPAWYNPPSKERHRAGHDSGRTRTNPLNEGEKSSFAVKDQVSALSNARIKQVDYDKDNSGVYRAKIRRDSFQAPVVHENENTEIDLPLDDLHAEEIKDEELPTLMRKPAQRLQLRQHSW